MRSCGVTGVCNPSASLYSSSSDVDGDEDNDDASGESNGFTANFRSPSIKNSVIGTRPLGYPDTRIRTVFDPFASVIPGPSHHAASSELGWGTWP